MEHSKFFSPSSMFRRLLCRGSAFLEAEAVDVGSPQAMWGTFCHKISEIALMGGSATSFLGLSMEGQVCDDEMIKCSETYQRDIAFLKRKHQLSDWDCKIEERLAVPGTDLFGTADFTGKGHNLVVISDLKSGMTEVDPVENVQMMLYGYMKSKAKRNRVILAISQPRTMGRSLSTWLTSHSDLDDWYHDEVVDCMQDINNGVDILVPGDDQCKYCKGKASCTAFSEYALKASDFLTQTTSEDQPIIIDEDMVNTVYPRIALLESFIKEVKAKAITMAGYGQLDDYKLIAGRKQRSWTNVDKAIKVIKSFDKDAYAKKPLTPAAAEKLSKEVKAAIQPYIDTGYQKDKIVKMSAKGVAIDSSANIFGKVTK